jgi:acetyl-CoA acetyltransferase
LQLFHRTDFTLTDALASMCIGDGQGIATVLEKI